MNLHELVFLRNSLQEALDRSLYSNLVNDSIAKLETVSASADYHYKEKIHNIAQQHLEIYNQAQREFEKIDNIIKELNTDINKLTQKFFTKNYQNECFAYDIDFIRNVKVISLSEGSDQVLLSRIFLYNSWKYPALEIGCRDGTWTKHLVGFDPLYITDHFETFLTSAASQFLPAYQARLRKYIIHDFSIKNLPIGQFGFIFSFNYFNYLSLDTIKQYLIQSMQWLRPGGTILFTYNNADLSASAGLCENYFMSYVPKSMLVPLAESLGFRIAADFDFAPSTSWIELQKPGELKTVKAHQALGEIKSY
jgi:hypothetical protein